MKAIVVSETGGPEQLSFADERDPTPGPGELLVDIAAAGVNFIDTYHRSGLYPMDLPFTPGLEGAGSVSAVGGDVAGFSVGDRVAWTQVLGSYAEKIVVPEDKAVGVPDDVELDVAAAVLLQGTTAHYLATDTYPVREGDTCLVHAGAGGVGLLLTQIAAMRGARVITTVSTSAKEELSRAAGASEVINYTETDFRTATEKLVGKNAVDVVYDGVGASTFDDGLELLRPRGMMVTFGNASGPVPPVSPLTLSQKGSIFLTRPTMAHYLLTRHELEERTADLFDWIGSNRLEVRIGHEYPLADATEAHEALEGRQTTGKVLLLP